MGKITTVRFETPPTNPLAREWEREARELSKSAAASPAPAFRVRRMQQLIELHDHETRQRLYELFRDPVFHLHYGRDAGAGAGADAGALEEDRGRRLLPQHALRRDA